MKNKKQFTLFKKIKYILNGFISKGFLAQILLLVIGSFILTLIFGAFAFKLGEENYTEGYWTALMHMIDQGTITADNAGTDAYYMFMLFVTFVGMAFTGSIIAIFTSSIQRKLEEMKKGHTPIVEKGHVLVLGFNENAYTICKEINEGNKKYGRRAKLIVADDLSKEDMEHTLNEYQSGRRQFIEKSDEKLKNPKIIFRSGDLFSENTLSICSAETAKAVVVNRENDIDTIRILLLLANYLKKNNAYLSSKKMPYIVALIHNKENLSAAMAASEIGKTENPKHQYKIQILYDGNMLERLFAQACVQQGLHYVMDGLFNYRGSCIHIESAKSSEGKREESPLIGKTLKEIAGIIKDAIPIGIIEKNNDKQFNVCLNPSDKRKFKKEDRLIYLSEKDYIDFDKNKSIKSIGSFVSKDDSKNRKNGNYLLIGVNDSFPELIKNINGHYKNTFVNMITSKEFNIKQFGKELLKIKTIPSSDPYSWNEVNSIFDINASWFSKQNESRLTDIVIMSPENMDMDLADDKVIMLLLNIRKYLKECNCTDIRITSEMQNPINQGLLQKSNKNDFVVANGISNRMIAQVTDDPRKNYIIEEMLSGNNSSIKLKAISDYVDITKPFNFECVFQSALRNDEIPLGWLYMQNEENFENKVYDIRPKLILNPTNDERKLCHEKVNDADYLLVVLNNRYVS